MQALTPWRTTPQLTSLHEEFDRLLDRFFGRGDLRGGWEGAIADMPALESFLRNDELVVRVDLPGIKPEEVDLSVEGDRLTIRGERKAVEESEDRLYREVRYGRFERTVALPGGVDPDSVKATYHDGVLEITMAAPKAMVSKKVPIQTH
jgi:HSP20 family protein